MVLTIVRLVNGETAVEPSRTSAVPPHVWFVGSAIFHSLGPSFAVLLFARMSVGGVAWLRIASAGVVFAVWRRPWRSLRSCDTSAYRLIVGLGVVFAGMNYSYYLAIDRLPLGTVAAIEFVGPVALAAVGTRTVRNVISMVITVSGVVFLFDVNLDNSPAGLAWAVANSVLFATYVVLAHRLATTSPDVDPIDRLGAAMLAAAVVITPFGLGDAIPAFSRPLLLVAGIVVGVTSSVLPYVFDQIAMARLPRATYALFLALLPATAVVIGLIVLGQHPQLVELGGVALVIAGVALHRVVSPGGSTDHRNPCAV